MSLKSMTGFARTEGSCGPLAWHWEARSVNGRGLDIRVRLPAGFEDLEPQIREAAGRTLARGSLTVSLFTENVPGTATVRVNEAALEEVLAAIHKIRARTDAPPPRADGILALKGVLETVEPREDGTEKAARRAAILASLEELFSDLSAARAREGAKLAGVLAAQIAEIERLTEFIAELPARRPEAVEARLRMQVARLLSGGDGLDPVRLHQEAVLLAARADADEELARLNGHVAAARDLLRERMPAGRRLDFLAQELHREANTLCAKSNSGEMTRAGLALKAVIDQFREQAQNIE